MLLLLLIAVLTITIALLSWKCSYWHRHGIQGPYGWPIVGSMWSFVTARKHYGDVYQQIYNDYPELSYVGIYRLFAEPSVLVRSEEMLKEVMIRSFSHFQDNVLWVHPKRDAIVGCNPFIAKGEMWRTMRNELLPIFTPTKVKNSFPHIENVCKKLTLFVEANMKTNCFEAKDLFSKYTLDVVASAAFSLDGQSFTNQNSDFTQLAEDLFLPNQLSLLHTIALLFSPAVGNLIQFSYIPARVMNWLHTIIMNILNLRLDKTTTKDTQKDIIKSDFIQWLIENKQKLNEPVDRATIVGHCSTFLFEGFETSSSLMAFALYEYAINPLEQQKVLNEIDEVLKRYEGKLCHEALQEMTYLEASLYETLRLHPPMMALQKLCTKSFEFPPQCNGGPVFRIPEGMPVIVPVKAIHYDPEIYPNPLMFQPKRFLDDKDKRPSCSFLGFGEGPRMCPGGRFGLAQSKAGIVSLLCKYSVHLAKKDKQDPFEISPTNFLTATKHGIWIKFESRK